MKRNSGYSNHYRHYNCNCWIRNWDLCAASTHWAPRIQWIWKSRQYNQNLFVQL